jgi:hypothetical protein
MTTRVVLAGGLGNQLFQLAAGLAVSHGHDVTLNYSLANPRLTSEELPDISNFTLPTGVKLEDPLKANRLTQKIIGLCIRESAFNRNRTWITFLTFAATVGVSLLSRRFQRVRINSGIGLDHTVEKFPRNSLIIGYFQTYQWAEKDDVRSRLSEMINRTRENIPEVNGFLKPNLAVHVRLGDYKLENSFGIPSRSYYKSGIEYFKTLDPRVSLRIFSDEPEEVHQRLSLLPDQSTEIYADESQSPVEVLLAMSESDYLLIANSTFSWWAAYFAGFRNASVICPEPWFQRGNSPAGLIPHNWNRLSANYSEQIDVSD